MIQSLDMNLTEDVWIILWRKKEKCTISSQEHRPSRDIFSDQRQIVFLLCNTSSEDADKVCHQRKVDILIKKKIKDFSFG